MDPEFVEISATTTVGNQPQIMYLRKSSVVSYFVSGDYLTIMTMAGPIYTKGHTHSSFTDLIRGDTSKEPVQVYPQKPKAPIQQVKK